MEDGVALGPDDPCELTGVGAADDGKLNSLVIVLQEVGDVGTVGDGVDAHVGVALPPLLHLAVEFVLRGLPEVLVPRAEGEDR